MWYNMCLWNILYPDMWQQRWRHVWLYNFAKENVVPYVSLELPRCEAAQLYQEMWYHMYVCGLYQEIWYHMGLGKIFLQAHVPARRLHVWLFGYCTPKVQFTCVCRVAWCCCTLRSCGAIHHAVLKSVFSTAWYCCTQMS